MPIKITLHQNGRSSEAAWLCDNDWCLPPQIKAFETWLAQEGAKLSPAKYSADIGFAPRPDAAGGGGAITLAMMQQMLRLGMTLHLSEYPEMIEEDVPTQPPL